MVNQNPEEKQPEGLIEHYKNEKDSIRRPPWRIVPIAIHASIILFLALFMTSEALAKEEVITPCTCNAGDAFDKLALQGGPKVAMLGGRQRHLLVPVELRFKPVAGCELVAAVAASHDLKVAWVQGGKCAVLYAGASDAEVERVRKDLESTDAAVRRKAASCAGCLLDVRVVPLLVKAAKDVDGETARQAVIGLRQMSWDAVLLVFDDDAAVELIAAELDSQDARVCSMAAAALGSVGGEKALALLEKALAD